MGTSCSVSTDPSEHFLFYFITDSISETWRKLIKLDNICVQVKITRSGGRQKVKDLHLMILVLSNDEFVGLVAGEIICFHHLALTAFMGAIPLSVQFILCNH